MDRQTGQKRDTVIVILLAPTACRSMISFIAMRQPEPGGLTALIAMRVFYLGGLRESADLPVAVEFRKQDKRTHRVPRLESRRCCNIHLMAPPDTPARAHAPA